jgi:signal transduction histidine kinase/DNA-binding response OmpR family regulator
VAVKEDITERKAMEMELNRHRHHLETMVQERTRQLDEALKRVNLAQDSAGIGIWEWTLENDKLLWDSWMFQLYGMDVGSFRNTYKDWLRRVHPEDRDRTIREAQRGIESKDMVESAFRIMRADNEIRHIKANALITRDERGQAIKMVGTNMDVTESYEINKALIKAKETAEAANVTKSAFLANMSHEIRTPMNAVLGLTHMLKEGNPTSYQRQQLDKIDAAARHLLTIINDILDFSKIEAGKLQLEETDFALDSILDHVVSMLRFHAQQKGVALIIDTDRVPNYLKGDPTRLRQALLNYAANAVKFTEKGHVKLIAELMKTNLDGLLVRFSVEDTGIGIPETDIPKLFEAFSQVDTSSTRQYEGTGLGLAITQRLAKLMGGEVGVTTRLGKGSTFWFSAWLKPGDPKTIPLPSKPAQWKGLPFKEKRVLLVEDNAINREVAQCLLQRQGMLVDMADNGRIATTMVRETPYDLVLMDLQMPEMDGLEATRMIRHMLGKEKLPILAMTANIFEEDRRACKEAGMNDFVPKPVEPEQLFAAMAKWMKISPAQDVAVLVTNDDEISEEIDHLRQQLESIEGLDLKQGLAAMQGDWVAYTRLLRQFIGAHAEDATNIGACLKQGEHEEARSLAHSAKGAAGTLGLKPLQSTAAELEGMLKHGDASEKIQKAVENFAQAMDKLVPLIASLEVPETILIVEAPTEDLHVALARLNDFFAFGDTEGGQLLEALTPHLTQVFGDRVQTLRKAVDEFDFAEAQLILHEMMGQL